MAKASTPPAPAATTPTTALPVPNALRAYQIERPDADRIAVVASRFKYLPGHPKQIRFDAKAGVFKHGGAQVIGNTITFISLALRVFEDDILSMGRKLWAEVFFADETGAVCAVLFHGYSVGNLQKLNSALFYDDMQLTQVTLTAKATRKENKQGKGFYYIAEFSYTPADPAEVQARAEFAEDHALYREDTLTGTADVRLVNGYRLPAGYEPHEAPHRAQLAETTT